MFDHKVILHNFKLIQ